MNYWELIADKLSKAGWSWGCVSVVDSCGRTIWIADAHRDNGKRFVARSDEKLTAFFELERVVRVTQRPNPSDHLLRGPVMAPTPRGRRRRNFKTY
jgi:hypothetical protein